MALKKFNLTNIAEMDSGRIREAFEQAINRMRDDCRDRPGVQKPRKAQLIVSMAPTVGEDGEVDTIEVSFDIKETIPARQSRRYSMRDRGGAGDLMFNDLAPDDPDQMTIDAEGWTPTVMNRGESDAG